MSESVGEELLALPSVSDCTCVVPPARFTVKLPGVSMTTSSAIVGSVLFDQLLASAQFVPSPLPVHTPLGTGVTMVKLRSLSSKPRLPSASCARTRRRACVVLMPLGIVQLNDPSAG